MTRGSRTSQSARSSFFRQFAATRPGIETVTLILLRRANSRPSVADFLIVALLTLRPAPALAQAPNLAIDLRNDPDDRCLIIGLTNRHSQPVQAYRIAVRSKYDTVPFEGYARPSWSRTKDALLMPNPANLVDPGEHFEIHTGTKILPSAISSLETAVIFADGAEVGPSWELAQLWRQRASTRSAIPPARRLITAHRPLTRDELRATPYLSDWIDNWDDLDRQLHDDEPHAQDRLLAAFDDLYARLDASHIPASAIEVWRPIQLAVPYSRRLRQQIIPLR
jgi:hypothetical protein